MNNFIYIVSVILAAGYVIMYIAGKSRSMDLKIRKNGTQSK